jgi:hypothetical protein
VGRPAARRAGTTSSGTATAAAAKPALIIIAGSVLKQCRANAANDIIFFCT